MAVEISGTRSSGDTIKRNWGIRSLRVSTEWGIEPRGAVNRSVVPEALKVVIDHIGVIIVAQRRGVEPPDFVPLLVGAADNLVQLITVDVHKDMVAQGAGQRLDTTGVGVELVLTHPVGNVGRRSHGARGGYRYAISVLLKPEDVRRPEELERVEVAVGPDQDFLPGRQRTDNFRTARHTEVTGSIIRRWEPVPRSILVSPADKHRVKVRPGGGTERHRAKGDEVSVLLRYQQLHNPYGDRVSVLGRGIR